MKPQLNHEDDDEDDEDDEAASLIPSGAYDGLICAGCVRRHAFVNERAGKDGWMMIVPNDEGDGWGVIGRRLEAKEEKDRAGSPEVGEKRYLDNEEMEETAKRPRLENGVNGIEPTVTVELNAENAVARSFEWTREAQGDVFLAEGVRDKLKATLDVGTPPNILFPR